MRERLSRAAPAVLGLVLFFVALGVLRRELQTVSWHTLTADIFSTPATRLAFAVVLTALNYLVLIGYDFIAFAYIEKKLPPRKIAAASFAAYAIANNVGFALLSGTSVRYRFYSRWGVTSQEFTRIVFSCSTTFWLGLLTLGGLSLAWSPLPAVEGLPASWLVQPIGWLMAAIAPGYLVLTAFRRTPLRIKGFELPLPPVRLAAAQILASIADWTLAAAVLFALIPSGGAPFTAVTGAFLAAQLLGLASHVPGGLGVFEGLMVLLLHPFASASQLLPSLVVFRAVYYLLPLLAAIVGLVSDGVYQRRSQAIQATGFVRRFSKQFAPQALAILTFVAGMVLLFSGATPSAQVRLTLLDRFLPLGVLETSHFLGSLAGVALLLLSQGLRRRLDAAYYLTAGALSVGIVTSLLKGIAYEEAAFLTVALVLLVNARPEFDRKAAFFETRFSAPWIATVVAAIASSVWLGLFAFKHVEYSTDLWWQFEIHGEASRFLRATVGVVTALLAVAFARLIGYAPHDALEPTDDDLRVAGAIIASQNSASPHLVYLRDKALLFDESRSGFIMYGVQGRSWVALGDPVCPPDRMPDLIRIFLERCDDFGATPVFYQVRKDYLHHYVDFGLTFIKLGEEAHVDLQQFSLEGSQASRFRQVMKRLTKDGGTFRVLPPEEAAAILDELQAVSDDWLKRKAGGEKGFSLGFFDRDYLSRFPIAVIEREGRIQAFANLWPGPQKIEISADLMRYHHEAPKEVMESLFVHLLVWGKELGYRSFVLGMAPMSGFEQSPVAPLWSRLGIYLYEHGETVYNFQGLRAFKEKFKPVWEPRYMASPGGLRLPRILADVAALIAGGYRRVFLK